MSELRPILIDASDLRERIRAKAVAAIHESFPLDMRGKRLEVQDAHVVAKEYSPDEQRRARLTGGSLTEALKATLVLKNDQGEVLDTAKNFTLAHLPYLTERHTILSDGNEYQVANQLRRKPGVYTSRADNGELWSVFNLSRGKNFKVGFEPEKGTFHLNYGTSNVPLYPVVRALGASHEDVEKLLGRGVADVNARAHGKDGDTEKAISKLYSLLEHPALHDPKASHDAKLLAVKKRLGLTSIDPQVTAMTLGRAHSTVTHDAILDAAKRMLRVHKGEAPTDDVDALTFKTFLSLDDFLKEKLKLTARAWSPKAKFALSTRTNIREAVRPAPFSDAIRKWLTTSSLTAVPTGINPMELIDHAVKVTSLGEGGIGSDRAIPFDARMIHNTHFGALDPVRTPESSHSGVDIRATLVAHRDDHGNLYTMAKNVHTGKVDYLKAGDLAKYVVAFPGEDVSSPLRLVDAFVKGQVEKIHAGKVTHQIEHVAHLYSPATTLIPGLHGIQGNRAIMGSKMGTQALPLLEREAPLVQVKSHLPGDVSFEALYGHMIVPTAPVSGTVHKIEDGWVYIKPHEEKKAEEPAGKVAEDRPIIERRKLGPFTFNIEIKKAQPHQAEGQSKPKGTSEDYGHLPGYIGPDGDSLDFFVGRRHDGLLYSYEKQKRLNDWGELDEQAPWRVTDKKFVVGHSPEEAEEFHRNTHAYNTPTIRFANRQTYKDWAELQAHIDEHHKASKTAASKADPSLVKVPYSTMFPFPSKTHLNHDLRVKVGDKVEAGERLAESNYTRNGVLALGKNLRVAYVPYYGLNSNDAVVISEGASKALTSEHLYTEVFPLTAALELSKGKHQLYYGTKYTPQQYAVLDEHGVIKKGARVHPKDPMILGLTKVLVQGTDALLGRISKSLSKPYQECVLTWNHGTPGEVVDVVRTAGQITVLVKTHEQMQVGDKLCYDSATEVLTEEGWKPIASVTLKDRVASLRDLQRPEHRCFVAPQELHAYAQGGDMLQVLTEDVDLLVTMNHKMFLRVQWNNSTGSWKLYPACQAAGHGFGRAVEYHTGERACTVPSDAYTSIEDYREPVYGITVPSGVVYVRRNGKAVWSGNSGRYGNKGVVAKIVPDHEMLQDEKGHPIDLLLTSAGVVSRINPFQIIETAIGKVAEKTGKPILYDNNESRNAVEWADKLLKQHGIKDKEEIYDPVLKRKILGGDGKGVLVGRQFIYKLFKSTDTNFSGHGVGPYDLNEQPLKTGGEDSAKGYGKMELDALIAHNARNLLHEASAIKSQKNDEFWRAIQLGAPLPAAKPTFAFRKFTAMLEGAGLKVDKRGSKFRLLPMTDKDIVERSRGAITVNKTLIAKNLKPEKNGLFDPRLTGGPQGTLYAHIDLHEPIPHPVFREPVRRLLGMTEKVFEQTLAEHGGGWFKDKLAGLDVDKKLAELHVELKTAKGSELNDVVKQIKYLDALKKTGIKPHEAYIISKVPVIPPVFRPIIPQPNDPSQLMVADANKLYSHLMDSNHTLQTTAVESDRGKHRQQVFNAVSAIFGTEDVANDELRGQDVKGFLSNLAGVGSPKGGFFQRKLMRRTQDVSGRGTAVPDPNLGMDDVGVPEQMLWQMYDKLVTARLVRMGYPALDAKERVLKRDRIARDALLAETRERPVLINRAPTLHRWSIVAAYPKPVQGKTLRINPFIEKGMALDFDGDNQDSYVVLALKQSPIGFDRNRATYLDYVPDSASLLLPGALRLARLEATVAARFSTALPMLQGYDLTLCDLADFPHGEKVAQKEHISFYEVPENVFILSYDETTGTVIPQRPTHWSHHAQRERYIITLTSGRQIFSDDDPRAVYGVTSELEYVRRRPADSVGLFVPVSYSSIEQASGDCLRQLPAQNNAPILPINQTSGHLIGSLVGNGWLDPYRVNLAGMDEGVQRAFREDLEETFPGLSITYATYAHTADEGFGDSLKTSATSDPGRALPERFEALFGQGAENKHLPTWFLGTPYSFRLGLLAGLIDTDGSIASVQAQSKKKPQWLINYSSRSGRLAREIVLLAQSLGVRAQVTLAKTPQGLPYYVVNFSTVEMAKLHGLPLRHTRKADRFQQFLREPPVASSSYNATNLVPVPVAVAKRCSQLYQNSDAGYTKWYKSRKTGYVSRAFANETLVEHSDLRDDPSPLLRRWIALVDNTSVRWDRVVSFEKTGIKEDGYDLTVPGYETFMNVEGVILSNTLQVHAPITLAAIEDARHMTLSNMLMADQRRNSILAFPQHEAIIGFTHASKQLGTGSVKKFKTVADARAAYLRGEVKLSDNVEIEEHAHKTAAEEGTDPLGSVQVWLDTNEDSDA